MTTLSLGQILASIPRTAYGVIVSQDTYDRLRELEERPTNFRGVRIALDPDLKGAFEVAYTEKAWHERIRRIRA